LNVALPLIIGSIIYPFKTTLLPILKNHLADGLWAYALISFIMIIWERQIHLLWLVICVLTAAVFELCQYYHVVAGQADILDMLAYAAFFLLALIFNNLFKPKYIKLKHENN
jgi:hypothetical protein